MHLRFPAMIPATGLTSQSTIPILGVPVFGFFFGLGMLLGCLYLFTHGARKYQLPRNLVLHWIAITSASAVLCSRAVASWSTAHAGNGFASGGFLDIFHGISSTGLMFGSLLGSTLFVLLFRASALGYFAVGFESFALVAGVGRIGCALLHEHLGRATSSVLGVRFADGSIRFDLGLYECVFLLVFVSPYVWLRRNSSAQPQSMVAALSLRYGLFRFLLELLRDEAPLTRFTFAQSFSLFLLLLAGWLTLAQKGKFPNAPGRAPVDSTA